MTFGGEQVGHRPMAVFAWTVAAAAGLTALTAAAVAPRTDIPWDAVSFPLLFGVPGALIAGRAPRGAIGWLMLFVASCFAGNAIALQLLAAGHSSAWLAWWAGRGSAVLVPATLLLVLLLPDGHLPSRRWRPLTIAVVSAQLLVISAGCLTPGPAGPDDTFAGASLSNPAGLLPQAWDEIVLAAIGPALVLPFLLGAAAVVQRLRHPDGDQRPRVVIVLVSLLVFVLLVTVPDLAWPQVSVWFHIAGAGVLCGSILGAVLRERFDRVQVVMSHTLVYGFLTVAVISSYVVLVALTTQLDTSDRLAGPLAAGVALALLPARGTMQRVLRRAMYGDRGQPHVALRRLSASVAQSDDLDGVLTGLARSVQASLRARWVEVEFREARAHVGTLTGHALVEERVLDGGAGVHGCLRLGLGPGRQLKPDERELLTDLVDQGARTARAVCLAADLADARQELVESHELERARLRRDLHDELGPVLAGLAMQLGTMPALVTSDAELAADRLARLEGEARGALDRMRRISRDLRPPALDELGLVPAVVEVGRSLGMDVRVTGTPVAGLSPAAEVAAYRIAAEAVLNAHRHTSDDSVRLLLALHDGDLHLEVSDHGNGRGDTPDGVGIRSMRARAGELGGTVDLIDEPHGGMTVRLHLPGAVAREDAR